MYAIRSLADYFKNDSSRLGRSAFWLGMLTIFAVNMFWRWSDNPAAYQGYADWIIRGGLQFLVVFHVAALAMPSRLNDIGRSGWWVLLLLIPGLGTAALAVMLMLPSGQDNRYGKAPAHVKPKAQARSAPSTGFDHSVPSTLTELERLVALRRCKAIDDVEFDILKDRILFS